MFATGDVFKMLVFYSVLVRQYDNIRVFFRCQYVSTLSTAMFSCILVFYSVLVRQYAQYGHVLCMLVFYSVLVRQYAQYGRVLCISVFCSVLVRQYAQYGHVLMYVVILFSLSTLVRLVRPCSMMYVGIVFGLSTLVRLVRPCSMQVFLSVFVRQYAQYGHVLLMLAFYSVLVRLVRPCSLHAGISFGLSGISFGLSTLSTANCSIFIGMHAWLSSVLPQSTACNKDS